MLDEDTISYLLDIPKPVSDAAWRSQLLPPTKGEVVGRGRFDLDDLPPTGPIRGRLHLYSRRSLFRAATGDWSVGLVFADYAGRSYRLLRCNGPHTANHRNLIERDRIVRSAHVHRLTERYQLLDPPRPDGYAEATDDFDSLESALDYLAAAINLQPEGRLWL